MKYIRCPLLQHITWFLEIMTFWTILIPLGLQNGLSIIFQEISVISKIKTKIERGQLGRLLKLSIFVTQKAVPPKKWDRIVSEVHCIGTIRCSVATFYYNKRCHATSIPLSTNQKVVVGAWWV